MNEDNIILGYDSKGDPIYECKRGYIYTAACIRCSECKSIIRGMGGPKFGSICFKCHNKSQE